MPTQRTPRNAWSWRGIGAVDGREHRPWPGFETVSSSRELLLKRVELRREQAPKATTSLLGVCSRPSTAESPSASAYVHRPTCVQDQTLSLGVCSSGISFERYRWRGTREGGLRCCHSVVCPRSRVEVYECKCWEKLLRRKLEARHSKS